MKAYESSTDEFPSHNECVFAIIFVSVWWVAQVLIGLKNKSLGSDIGENAETSETKEKIHSHLTS